MKSKKIIIIIVSVVVVLSGILIIVFSSANSKTDTNIKDEKPIYLDKKDNIIGMDCYSLDFKRLNCDSDEAYINKNWYLKNNAPVQKVLVSLNDTDKDIFYVLKGNIEKNEDLLLIYDGSYKYSPNEQEYTYKRGLEILKELNWTNAKYVRLLTDNEARLLGCSEDTSCKWIHNGLSFIVSNNNENEKVMIVNSQGYLMDSMSSDPFEEKYDLRPVIQISSKYVKLYSTTSKLYFDKDGQRIEMTYLDGKLTNINIIKSYVNLSQTEYNNMENEISSREDSDMIKYSTRTGWHSGSYYIYEYIDISFENISLQELNKYISLSSKDITQEQLINEMKNNGYNQR